jgi:creatinine amidohydrolase/Fe(II)-dependent formamide hydrolase-like protein
VRAERLGPAAERFRVDELTDPPGPAVDEPVWLHEWSADGALGEPARASAEAGQRIVAAVHDRAAAYARRLLDRPLPEERR